MAPIAVRERVSKAAPELELRLPQALSLESAPVPPVAPTEYARVAPRLAVAQ
jgi:hypothetical protein